MQLPDWILLASAIVGHFVLWVMLFNRMHSTGLPCALLKALDKILGAIFLAILVGIFVVARRRRLSDISWDTAVDWLILCYWIICCLAGLWVVLHWVRRRFVVKAWPGLISNDVASFDVAAELERRPVGNLKARLLSHIPGNHLFRLDINTKAIGMPNLDERLNGLSIVHLSDLHFTGGITRGYFEFAIERANQLDGDIVAVTGDILDYAQYIDWIPQTLGRLRSRLGVYFVLGNHDKRIRDVGRLRGAMADVGLIDLGGSALSTKIRDVSVLLAGNELPWFGTRRQISAAVNETSGDFRILLSHSPDQLSWARQQGFDLMLAGHTHGGQISLPMVGPLVAPSCFGVKYASGLFFESPTVLHVSRGVSAQHPIRINCPQEISKLVLHCAHQSSR